MTSSSHAAAAFDRYAEEWRRNARVKHDPGASQHQKEQQQQRTDAAYAEFWLAFTGRPMGPRHVKLSLATSEGRRVGA